MGCFFFFLNAAYLKSKFSSMSLYFNLLNLATLLPFISHALAYIHHTASCGWEVIVYWAALSSVGLGGWGGEMAQAQSLARRVSNPQRPTHPRHL